MAKQNEEVTQLKQQVTLLESNKEALQDYAKQLQELNHAFQHEVPAAVQGQGENESRPNKPRVLLEDKISP